MSLFQKSVEKKYLAGLDSVLIDKKFSDFQEYFGNSVIQENIRNSKEEQFQEGFFRELFVKILDYTLNPDPNFNLTTEFKNISDSKKADGAILRNENAIAVIELKSTSTTDLSSVETQAFGYKNHHPNCTYIITSNFEKLRFYIQNAVDYLEFDLFNLNREQFCLLWLCLAKDNILNDLALTIKESSVIQEESVTKQLYADYSKFREEVFESILKNNSNGEHGTVDPLILFKKTQKLLDRFLFIFFTEDTGLLPPNTITEIVNQWTELKENYDEEFTLYSRFVKFFGYLNTGYKGKKYDIYPYNGGLFLPDEILDNINIDDEILKKHTLKLTAYDFETDIDVNILGHIFEHSLTEIENMQAKLRGEEIDKQKTKRKKDGIFYTPKYITKYIVENTIGKLCDEKRIELEIIDEEYAKGRKNRKKEILKNLDDKLTQYRNWLLSLTILDPACGSGAFLNQALEFLINEHKKIDEFKAQLLGGTIVFSDITNDILEKNIFGVDINDESVEIAKLSLWLRTAQKGRKLSTLSNNIKCGNSLIDDAEVAGDKAFNWQKEFPEIFAKGGFDVVIGNPPYVKARDNEDIKGRKYIEENYKSPYKMWDLYIPFVEKGIDLLKSEGLMSMIIPDTIGKSEYTTKLMDLIENNYYLFQIDFFPDIYVFENVGVRNKIIFIRKSNVSKTANRINHNPTIFDIKYLENKLFKGYDQYLLEVSKIKILVDDCIALGDICYVSYGMRLNSDKADPNKFKKTDLLSKNLDHIHFKKYTEGKYLDRYKINSCQYLEYNTERCPNRLVRPTFPELYPPGKILLSRQKKVAALSTEGHYCDNTIIMAIPAFELKDVDNNSIKKYYQNISKDRKNVEILSLNFDLKYLLAIVNSKLIAYYIKFESKGKIDFYPDDWKRIPIKNITKQEQSFFCDKTDFMLEKINDFNDVVSNFSNLMISKFEMGEKNSKLENWHELEFAEFLKELKKSKVQLRLSDEAEWMEYFNKQKQKAQALQTEISKTDKEIDQMVYELYGLTEEEIGIVEGAL